MENNRTGSAQSLRLQELGAESGGDKSMKELSCVRVRVEGVWHRSPDRSQMTSTDYWCEFESPAVRLLIRRKCLVLRG